jgi:hypothetical protein
MTLPPLAPKTCTPCRGGDPPLTFSEVVPHYQQYVTVSLQTKKIKGLHENDFIMAAKLDELASQP